MLIIFSPTEEEDQLIKKYTGIKSKIYCILQLGYFKATKQFYQFSLEEARVDVEFIIKKYFISSKKEITGTLWKEIYHQQKLDILNHYAYKEWSSDFKSIVMDHLNRLIRLHPKGNDTLRELFVFLERQRITIPSYRIIQDIFTKAFGDERNRLDIIMLTITKDLQEKLDAIIKNDNGLSQLNIIRSDQKDFKYFSFKSEIKKVAQLEELYRLSVTLIPSLLLSNNAIRYYGSLAEIYTASRIRKLAKPQQWLHVLCFAFHRYKEFMDNLITSFLFHVRSLCDDAKSYAKIKEDEYIKNLTMDLPKLAQFIKWFSSESIDPEITYKEFSKIGFGILSKEKQVAVADFIEGTAFNRKAAKWEFYTQSYPRIAMYLRPVLLAVDFEFYKKDGLTIELIMALRDYYLTKKPRGTLPQLLIDALNEKIPSSDLLLLQDDKDKKQLNVARLEFYMYEKMVHHIDRGLLFCNNSVSYCSLDYDLIPDELVDKAHEIVQQFGYSKVPVYCDERLEQALADLEVAWKQTNDNIKNGSNNDIKIQIDENGVSTWKLSYDTEETEDSDFFNILPKTDITDVMKFVGDKLNIWPIFTHLKDRYTKHKNPDPLVITACVLSDAFGFGIEKMAEISNVSYHHLRAIKEDFIHMENLYRVNDVVSNYIHGLSVSRAWDLQDNTIVADADGQKFETSRHTIQSRYSSKYFGTYKGISVYTLLANNIPVNSKIIGPNDHESHHLYDVLYGNETNILIDKVTGDTHSINQANFVALDSIDIAFIPSIKNIRAESEKLYSVCEPNQYQGLIKPFGKINRLLIKSEKRGIVRILLSLLLQENTQTVIIRKLSSHKRYNRLRAALWEYNKIFKSTHVLNLINDIQLRKVIKTARNRTESYHQLQRTVRKIYSGVFKGAKIIDNAISNQVSRLVCNCIIAYNAMHLEQVYQRLVVKFDETVAKSIMKNISPVAWQHIVFTGRYYFRNKHIDVEVAELVEILEERRREAMLLKRRS